jgi:hypothetical protein
MAGDLTPLEWCHVVAARQALADAQTMNLLDGAAMARMIGRLEVVVERLVGMVDPAPGGDRVRCPAAHPEDPTPCTGPIVVTILDAANAGADGCEHHAARLLASIAGGRPVAKPDAPAGVALRLFRAAPHMRPFPWRHEETA